MKIGFRFLINFKLSAAFLPLKYLSTLFAPSEFKLKPFFLSVIWFNTSTESFFLLFNESKLELNSMTKSFAEIIIESIFSLDKFSSKVNFRLFIDALGFSFSELFGFILFIIFPIDLLLYDFSLIKLSGFLKIATELLLLSIIVKKSLFAREE